MTGGPGGFPRSIGEAPPRHREPQEYHRILRTWNYRPWRPVLGLIVLVGSYVLMAGVIAVAGLTFEIAVTGVEPTEVLQEITPASLVMINLALAAAIPAAMLAMLAGHGLPPGWLGSVIGRLRWRLFLPFGGLALAVTVATTLLSGFIPVDEAAGSTAVGAVAVGEWLAFAAVVTLTTPLQAAGEEYAFRGYLNQALGAWVRSPWFAMIITSTLFALAHGGQNPALFVDRFTFGMVAGWMVWRTGGLEAAIAAHVVNNAVTFLVAAAFDQVSDSLEVTDIPWSYAALDVASMLVLAWLVGRSARRRKLDVRTRALTG